MKNMQKNRKVRPRNTLRVALVFVAVMLVLQFSFSSVYLVQNHQKSAALRQETAAAFQEFVEDYYAQAQQLLRSIQSLSCVAELSHRETITQKNIEKVNTLVGAIQNAYAAHRDRYADIFVYFPASDTLYSQRGLCNRSDLSDPRYVSLDLSALTALEEGAFSLSAQRISTDDGSYSSRLIGIRGRREIVLLTCSDETVAALSENSLKLTQAQAAYFDESGDLLAASPAMAALTLDEAMLARKSGVQGLSGFSFSAQTLNGGGTLFIGFSKNLPNEAILRNNLMIMFVNVFCLIAIALFAFIYHRQLYRPIQSVIAQSQFGAEASESSEFQSIALQMEENRRTIEETYSKMEETQRKMEQSRREAEQFGEQYRLARQKSALSDLAMGFDSDADVLPELDSAYVALSIVCERTDGEQDEERLSRLTQALVQHWNARAVCQQGRQRMFFVPLGQQPPAALQDFLAALGPGSGAMMAISQPHEALTELHRALEEASDALLCQPADVQGLDFRIVVYNKAQQSAAFLGAGATLETTLHHCIETGDADGCRALLEPLYEDNRSRSVLAQQELCLYLVNLMQFGRESTAADRQQRSIRIRNSFCLQTMWQSVEELFVGLKPTQPQEEESWRRIEQFIHENFADMELSLQSVANHMGWSYSYASRFFKQMNGGGFASYVTQLRIEEAKRLLACTDLPVGDILAKTGFSVFSSFSRSFKKATGFSPSEYRDKMQQDPCLQGEIAP